MNFFAPCRVAREDIRSRMGYWPGGERAVGAVVELVARREAARLEVGLRARTLNICFMLVTLAVLKLSGWLNFFAPCPESQGRTYEAG